MTQERTRTLFVFDFDHTLIDDNSDTWIMSLCPELKLKETLSSKRKEYTSWTKFMDHVFFLIHKQGCTKDEIIEHMKKVQLFEQAKVAVHAIHENNSADSIILSDSNTVFIDSILEGCGMRHMFKSVISNPAHFESDGRLRVLEYHSHTCETCQNTPNLCKGAVLKEYLHNCKLYSKVVYVGDGRNDYCPSVMLNERDVVLCREGYALSRCLLPSSSCLAKINSINFISSLNEFVIDNLPK